MAGDGLQWPDEESEPQDSGEACASGQADADLELRQVEVSAVQHQARLDKALAELVPEFSRSYLQQLLSQGCVRLNDQVAHKPAHKVRAGDRVVVDMSAYGLRVPFTRHVLVGRGRPQRGEVAVFASPEDGTRLI